MPITLHSPPPKSASWKPGTCGGAPGRPLHAEHAGAREVVDVMPRAAGQGPVLPVAGERAHDEARVRGEQCPVRQAKAVEHTWTELLEQDVVALDHPEQGDARARLLQVEARAPLAAVEREEGRRGVPDERRRQPQVVARPGVLHLVDLAPRSASTSEARGPVGAASDRGRGRRRAAQATAASHWKLKSFCSFIASIWLPVDLELAREEELHAVCLGVLDELLEVLVADRHGAVGGRPSRLLTRAPRR